jgi:hypothetical protein
MIEDNLERQVCRDIEVVRPWQLNCRMTRSAKGSFLSFFRGGKFQLFPVVNGAL